MILASIHLQMGVGNIRSDQTVNLAQSNHFKILRKDKKVCDFSLDFV